jgi:hypothetical protein
MQISQIIIIKSEFKPAREFCIDSIIKKHAYKICILDKDIFFREKSHSFVGNDQKLTRPKNIWEKSKSTLTAL